MNVQPSKWIVGNSKWSSFIRQFSFQSGLQTNSKQEADGFKFLRTRADTQLICLNTQMRNTISFNHLSNSWKVELNNIRSRNKGLLNYGLEERTNNEWNLKSMVNIGSFWSYEGTLSANELMFTPAKFIGNGYYVISRNVDSKISYQQLSVFRITVGGKYDIKKNAEAYETANRKSLYTEGKWNADQRSLITGRINFETIKFTGKAGSNVAYIMLNGLLPGNNLIWAIDVNRRLLNNLEFTLQYEGRKLSMSSVVHTAKASAKMIF